MPHAIDVGALVEIGYMNPGRWRHIADTSSELGILPAGMSLQGFLYEANPRTDLIWVYRALGGTLGIAVLAGLVQAQLSTTR